MKNILLLLLLVPLALRSHAQDLPVGSTLNALVTVQVGGLDPALWTKVNARVMMEKNMNVEYSCITTGIIVLRMQVIIATEKSDVMAIVRRMLYEAGVKGRIEFLDVHVEEGDGNKCSIPVAERGTVEC